MSAQEEPTTDQGETPETTLDTPETGDTATPPWGNDFDPQRAWNTIQNLRKFEDEAAALRKDKEEREKSEQAAERKRLEENQEFQKIAESTQAELDSLKPTAEKAERYEAALKRHLDVERDGLPAHILTLLDRMDVADQLEYIAENRETLRPQENNRKGVPDTPKPSGSQSEEQDRKARERMAAAYRRSF